MLLTLSTTHPRLNGFLSHWNAQKSETTFFRRLGMHSLEVVGLAVAMLVIPLTMHRAVQGIDEMYEIVGRRSKSPYARLSWVNIIFAAVIMVGWHLWLGRLTYLTVLEGGADDQTDSEGKPQKDAIASSSSEKCDAKMETRAISWGRLLGRIVIPLLLGTLGLHFGYQVLLRATADPRPLVTRNDVDMQEAMAQLYGLL